MDLKIDNPNVLRAVVQFGYDEPAMKWKSTVVVYTNLMSNGPNLVSLNPDAAKSARNEAVENICNTLRGAQVVLVQWRRR